MERNVKILIGVAITLVYLLVNLFIMNDYGVSWDFHYHNFAGLYHLGQKVPKIDEPTDIPFSPPDPRLTVEDPFGPFIQVLPTLSYLIFYEKLHWLPFDSAYNLPSVIFGSLGILVLFLFLYESINFHVALFSAIFLALLPTHFGYLHNNMKDIPNAFAFTLSIYLFWRLVKFQRLKDLLFALLAFAFAFNVKINSVMIPVVCLGWFLFLQRNSLLSVILGLLRHHYNSPNSPSYFKRGVGDVKIVLIYFILAPVAALLVWWPFWRDPIGKLLELPYFYSRNTLNMPVLLFGNIFRSGVNIPWIYPWVYIFITTPLSILFFFLIGGLFALKNFFKKNEVYALLLLWFLIPLLRYFSSKVSAIDGMRHFMEIVYPLSAFAGIGFYFIFQYVSKVTKQRNIGNIIFVILVIVLSYNLIKFHPYQTSFYNALIGGIKGAEGKFDIDFWGSPQKDAMKWLNKNAAYSSYVNVVMAQSSAAMYARDDLLEKLNKKSVEDSDYSVVLNKRSFFVVYPVEEYLKNSINNKKVVYTKTIDGIPLFWVIKNGSD